MTGDISQLSNIVLINGGGVKFAGGDKGMITQKGTVSSGGIRFDDVNYVPELKANLLSVSQICDNDFSTHFNKKEYLILKPQIIIPQDWILLKSERKGNAYFIDMSQSPSQEMFILRSF